MKMSDEVKPQTFQAVKFLQRWSTLSAGKQGKVETQALPAPTRWPAVFKLKARLKVVALTKPPSDDYRPPPSKNIAIG